MARLPLTVYLPRAELAKLDTLARRAGIARSAFAGDAIRSRLVDTPGYSIGQGDLVGFLRAAVEELLSVHPDGDAIRSRLAHRFASPNQAKPEGNVSCQSL